MGIGYTILNIAYYVQAGDEAQLTPNSLTGRTSECTAVPGGYYKALYYSQTNYDTGLVLETIYPGIPGVQ
jgi:hypothetical protein